MIAFVSIAFASWEAYAITTKRRTITDYSHTWPWSLLVWGWMAWLALHFIAEARA